MKETVIIDLGIIPYSMIKEYAETSNYNIVYIGKRFLVEPLKDLNIPNEVFCYEDFNNPISEHADTDLYSDIFNDIINDYQTQLIAERVSIRYGYRSNHNDIATIDVMIENYLKFFIGRVVKYVCFQACPHALNSWVFANVAEHLGIKIYMCNNSIFYWRYVLEMGTHEETLVNINGKDADDKVIKQYIDNVNKKYEDAIPEYERQRMKKRKNKIWSWRNEIKYCLKDFRKLYYLPFKYELYKTYKELCQVPDLNEKYVIVFFHFQPERTSMPEGRSFSNQWHMINTIHRALPADCKLYVKEHPATFTNAHLYDPRYRNVELYRNISQLSNTCLVDLSVDSFSLIDNCFCLATITGTVGGEGLFRGKPVLTFGNATYRNHRYVYDINTPNDVEEALRDIRDINAQDVKKYTEENYIPQLIHNSMSGLLPEVTNVNDAYTAEVRNRGIARVFGKLLKGEITE